MGSPGAVVTVGGNITTIYDSNDQPTESQVRDREGRIVSRFVRTYDANGRILEEKEILKNPVSLMADKLAAEQPPFNFAQVEAVNRIMKSMLGGPSGITYAYDAQGRVTEMRDRNCGSETKFTTISYNEHADKSAERETMTGNSAVPGFAEFHIDEDGTLTPSIPADEPTELPDRLLSDNEVRYAYEYDSYGNWTQQTENRSYGPDIPSYVHVRHRKLTYY